MADLIHVVHGDLEAFASNAQSLSDELTRLSAGVFITSVSGTMPGSRSTVSAPQACQAVDRRIGLRSAEYREFSEQVSRARGDYARADNAVEQKMNAVSCDPPARSDGGEVPHVQKILERLGG